MQKSGLSFLVAARECEIGELEQLALTSEMVGAIGHLIHALQKERGISNVFLGSRGALFARELALQPAQCEAAQSLVAQHFDALDTAPGRVRNGARLFSRIALVLHALDGLPGLRKQIAAQSLQPAESTAAFMRLIAGLLVVVFEAADNANDPSISRALVALFNFMQGKEFAGQERACGAATFVSGRSDAAAQQQWTLLIDSQERCFQVFADFSDPAVADRWHAGQHGALMSELERMRRIGVARTRSSLDPDMSQKWFEICTSRIDAMRTVEDLLAANLRQMCVQAIAQARAELRDQQLILVELTANSAATGSGQDTGISAAATAPYGPQLERSILGMVQEQAQRLEAMGNELETARAALNERKVIERAKGLLMATRKLSEDDAYKMLRQTAMSQNRRVVDVAQSVLTMTDYL